MSTSLTAKICLQDEFICLNRGWIAFSNLFALIEDDNPLSEAHYELHIVLDYDKRDPSLVNCADLVSHAVDHSRVDCRGGFVQEDDVGIKHECCGEGQELTLTIGEFASKVVGMPFQADEFESLFRPALCGCLIYTG